VTERFLREDPPDAKRQTFALPCRRSFARRVKRIQKENSPWLGSGGTLTTLVDTDALPATAK
jgi:hypothetical protein